MSKKKSTTTLAQRKRKQAARNEELARDDRLFRYTYQEGVRVGKTDGRRQGALLGAALVGVTWLLKGSSST